MSERMARAALAAYRMAGAAAYPMLGAYVTWRASRGKEERPRRRERYGFPSVERPATGPVVWVHAASVGESNAVVPLVREIAGERIHVVMTTGTVTSAAMVQDRLGDSVIHQYVPLDLRPSVMRFLDHWRPDLAIVAESEIWPTTMMELQRRRVPQVLVNARLSDRSFRRWKAAPSIAEALLENLSHVVAQSDIDGERFHVLGARAITVAGNLKAEAGPPPFDPMALREVEMAIRGRAVWAAVSTHQGEEAVAVDVHRALRLMRPDLLTIVVPRHVERADALGAEFAARGLNVARRSAGQVPDGSTDIFLGDTMGEMGLYLRLTEIAFVGRSLAGHGGQNPLEAAMLGTAILSGRYVQNFRDIYLQLLRRGGARLVKDGDNLRDIVAHLLDRPDLRRGMMAAAGDAAGEMRGALTRTMQALEPFIHPLRIAASLEGRARGPAR
ncbi:lipid IV(A) 3-deoxy-D-manno-octulosonic acid transferase [Aureimonas leprariae]|uniref:3-deoxy-D-manno-octulosonic acid transferase n=1 Tax=Plantimonas leprariae TaxID=2615207 RepID=A0A7V7PST2_9HYPH|nr:lipid IV(A) 3-deoxy-D-manno-octulosonic acid transferase [Aureimonas leprariae]KAB0682593.1 3-deoxy-D-manno-octulosonic acid transferase [Aureimonas leprariae]